jgi:hypothetical protein
VIEKTRLEKNMYALRQIYDCAPAVIEIPDEFVGQAVEILFLSESNPTTSTHPADSEESKLQQND